MARLLCVLVIATLCVIGANADCVATIQAMTVAARADFFATCSNNYGTDSCIWPLVRATSYNDTSSPACCPNCTPCPDAGCATVDIPFCAAGATPTANSVNSCCPSCRPVPSSTGGSGGGGSSNTGLRTGGESARSTASSTSTCTSDQIHACAATASSLPVCGSSGTTSTPVRNPSTCCYNCRPPCIAVPPICATGVSPSKTEYGCPTCIAATSDSNGCTEAQNAACAAAWPTLATCADGVTPVRSPCCYQCKPRESSNSGKTCSDAQAAACRAIIDTLPLCGAGVQASWNSSTCCTTCRPNPITTTCTDAAFKECLAAAPVCGTDEVPLTLSTRCCPTCVRSERTCDIAAVAKCYAASPACGDNELPVRLDGACCPTCRLAKKCDMSCSGSGSRICIRVPSLSSSGVVTYTPTCFGRRDFKFDLTVAGNLSVAFSTLNGDQIAQLIQEYVRRYCERGENADACNTYAHEIAALIVTVRIECSNGQKAVGGDVLADGSSDSSLSTGFQLFDGSSSDLRNSDVRAGSGCRVRVQISVADNSVISGGGDSSETRSSTGSSESHSGGDGSTGTHSGGDASTTTGVHSAGFRVQSSSTSGTVVVSALTANAEAQDAGLSGSTYTTSTNGASRSSAAVSIIAAAIAAALAL